MENKNRQPAQPPRVDLLRLAKALWRRIWIIFLTAILFAMLAFTYAAYFVTPLYQAEVWIYVNNTSGSTDSANSSISSSELTAAQSLVDTYIVILKSRTTLEQVIGEAHLDYSYTQLREMLSVGAVDNTEVFSITVTDRDPQEAAQIANTIAQILPEQIADVVTGSSVKIIDYASAPTEPSCPSIPSMTAKGLLLGLVLACAAIVLAELLDNKIHDENDLLELYHLPVLAVIPDYSDTRRSRYDTREERDQAPSTRG